MQNMAGCGSFFFLNYTRPAGSTYNLHGRLADGPSARTARAPRTAGCRTLYLALLLLGISLRVHVTESGGLAARTLEKSGEHHVLFK